MDDELFRLYELEAQIEQAIHIMLNLSASVKALKPKQCSKKMTKDEILNHFRSTRKQISKNMTNR